jgi:hypothetical protein
LNPLTYVGGACEEGRRKKPPPEAEKKEETALLAGKKEGRSKKGKHQKGVTLLISHKGDHCIYLPEGPRIY